MASTPPLSPTPRRWSPANTGNNPSPVVQTLTALADNPDQLLTPTRPSSSVPDILTTSPSPQHHVPEALSPQHTGGTLMTLNARYDDVFAQLDALAASSAVDSPTPTVPARQLAPSPITSLPPSPNLSRTPTAPSPTTTPVQPRMPAQLGLHGLGISIRAGPRSPDILDTLTEHTEPSSSDSGRSAGPVRPPKLHEPPTPSSPLKIGGGKGVRNLRDFFEVKTSDSQQSPVYRSSPEKRGLPTPANSSSPVKPTATVPAPASPAAPSVPLPATRLYSQPSPKPKPTSPLPAWRRSPPPKEPSQPPAQSSSFRNIIASWSARTATETAAEPQSLHRDRATNFSLRRRRRNDSVSTLAEVASDRGSAKSPSPSSTDKPSADELPRHVSPAPSSRAKSSPKILTGQPQRIGSVYFYNVHDPIAPEKYAWVRTDARLYVDGLQLNWRTLAGADSQVTLDLEFCDEVHSMYCPTHPEATDVSAIAAREQGIADILYPLKMVYDDGTERIAFDSARERASWSGLIWKVLEQRHVLARASSALSNRSEPGSGSGSTRYSKGGSPPTAHQTTDDAVVSTAGGFTAPLVSRDSRRLAAGSGKRQLLRRVASDVDLRELVDASPGVLTPESAKQPATRDFVFARGIPPPPLSPQASARTPSSFGTALSRSPASRSRSGPTSPRMQYSPSISGDSFRTPGSTDSRDRIPSPVPPSERSSSSLSVVTAPLTVPLPSGPSTPRRRSPVSAEQTGSTGSGSGSGTAVPRGRSQGSGSSGETRRYQLYDRPMDEVVLGRRSSFTQGHQSAESLQPTAYDTAQPPTSFVTAPTGSAYGTGITPSSFGTAPPGSQYGSALPPSSYGTAQPPSSFGTALPGSQYGSMPPPSSFGTAPAPSSFGTAQPPSSFGTAMPGTEYGSAPAPSTFGTAMPPSSFGTAPHGSQYGLAQPPSTFATAQPPSSFGTAPPGTQYGSAPTASSFGTVPHPSSFGTASQPSHFSSAQPPTSFQSAATPSNYDTVPPVTSYASVPPSGSFGTAAPGTAYGSAPTPSTYHTAGQGSTYGSAPAPPSTLMTAQQGSIYGSAPAPPSTLMTAQQGSMYDTPSVPTSFADPASNYGSAPGLSSYEIPQASTQAATAPTASVSDRLTAQPPSMPSDSSQSFSSKSSSSKSPSSHHPNSSSSEAALTAVQQSNYTTAAPVSTTTAFASGPPATPTATRYGTATEPSSYASGAAPAPTATRYGTATEPSSFGTPVGSSSARSFNTASTIGPELEAAMRPRDITRATTPVSEPDVDFEMLAELERLSSVGSSASSRSTTRIPRARSSAYGTANEVSSYGTATTAAYTIVSEGLTHENYATASSIPSTATRRAPTSVPSSRDPTLAETVGSPPLSMRPPPSSTYAPTLPETVGSPPLAMARGRPAPSSRMSTIPEAVTSPPLSMRPPPASSWAATVVESAGSPITSLRAPPSSYVSTIPESIGSPPLGRLSSPSTHVSTVVESLGSAPRSMRAPAPSTHLSTIAESVGTPPRSLRGLPSSTHVLTAAESIGSAPQSMRASSPSTAYPTMAESLGAPPASMRAPPPSTLCDTVPESLGSLPSVHKRAPPSISTAQSLAGSSKPPSLTTTAAGSSSYQTPQSISTAQSTAGSSARGWRKPVPQLDRGPPPDPTPPSTHVSSSHDSSATPSAPSTAAAPVPDYSMLRLVNYLEGQEQVRQGQTTRIEGQLERIENKLGKLDSLENSWSSLEAKIEARVANTDNDPPPVPSKDGHRGFFGIGDGDSASDSHSDTSSESDAETARPVTPPPLVIPAAFTQRLDDISILLGKVLGQQEDIIGELSRRRTHDLDTSRDIPLILDLVRNIRERVEETDYSSYVTGLTRAPSPRPRHGRSSSLPRRASYPPPENDADGGLWSYGADMVPSDASGIRVPPNSEVGAQRTPFLTQSLLHEDIGSPDFDDEHALRDLPSTHPPSEPHIPHAQAPQFYRRQRAPGAPQQGHRAEGFEPEYEGQTAYDEQYEEEPGVQGLQHPVPVRSGGAPQEERYEDAASEDGHLRPSHRGPTPNTLGLPTPQHDPRGLPRRRTRDMTPGPAIHGAAPSTLPRGTGPPPPASGPGLSAGWRPNRRGPPMTRSYYRPGHQPSGAAYPVGGPPMAGIPPPVPGPMGAAAFQPALHPVYPGSLAPGFVPRAIPPDHGLGNTTSGASTVSSSRSSFASGAGTDSRSTTSKSTTHAPSEPATPVLSQPTIPPHPVIETRNIPANVLPPAASVATNLPPAPPSTVPPAPSSYPGTPTPIRSVLPSNAPQSLAPPSAIPPSLSMSSVGEPDDHHWQMYRMREAQGEQQNEMARYLHNMSDQMKDMNDEVSAQLKDVLDIISRTRDQSRPERVSARVLPDGTVQLMSGEIVDGVRGAADAGAPASVSPAGCHVEGRVLPDGTVMVGDKVVIGVQGLPRAATAEEKAEEEARERERQTDARLRAAEDGIAKLLRDMTPRRDHIPLHNEPRPSPGSFYAPSERTTERNVERTETITETKEKKILNPRTGRPLTMPSPLSQATGPTEITAASPPELAAPAPVPPTVAGGEPSGSVAGGPKPATVWSTSPPKNDTMTPVSELANVGNAPAVPGKSSGTAGEPKSDVTERLDPPLKVVNETTTATKPATSPPVPPPSSKVSPESTVPTAPAGSQTAGSSAATPVASAAAATPKPDATSTGGKTVTFANEPLGKTGTASPAKNGGRNSPAPGANVIVKDFTPISPPPPGHKIVYSEAVMGDGSNSLIFRGYAPVPVDPPASPAPDKGKAKANQKAPDAGKTEKLADGKKPDGKDKTDETKTSEKQKTDTKADPPSRPNTPVPPVQPITGLPTSAADQAASQGAGKTLPTKPGRKPVPPATEASNVGGDAATIKPDADGSKTGKETGGKPPGGPSSESKPPGDSKPPGGDSQPPSGPAPTAPHCCQHCGTSPAVAPQGAPPPVPPPPAPTVDKPAEKKAEIKPVESKPVEKPVAPAAPAPAPMVAPAVANTPAPAAAAAEKTKQETAAATAATAKPAGDGKDKAKAGEKEDGAKQGEKKETAKEGEKKDTEMIDKGVKEAITLVKTLVGSFADLKKAVEGYAAEQKGWKKEHDAASADQKKRRETKAADKKKISEILDKILAGVEKTKGTQAVLDALKELGTKQSEASRKLADHTVDHLSNQVKSSVDEFRKAAREQVAFNLAGYMDNFSRSLANEVRVLIKEVGDLREARRSMHYELAELLLHKARQSGGDLMAVVPYPAKPPAKPAEKKDEKKKEGGEKKPQGPPGWTNYVFPPPPPMGMPPPPAPPVSRPLPNPNVMPFPGAFPGPIPPPPSGVGFNMVPQPMPPPAGPATARPLPIPK